MRITQDNSDAEFTYLSINGNAITYDTNITESNTGPITASVFTDRVASRNAKELALNFTIASVSGTSPTLAIEFLMLDVMEPSNGTTGIPPTPLPPAVVTLTIDSKITTASTARFVISNGQGIIWKNNVATTIGPMNVPMLWQVRLKVGGTTPSFSIIATLEERT